jgi:hypothetical protein
VCRHAEARHQVAAIFREAFSLPPDAALSPDFSAERILAPKPFVLTERVLRVWKSIIHSLRSPYPVLFAKLLIFATNY